jgi:hypothetical protein
MLSGRSPRGEQGQIVPLMIALMILILIGGMVVFWLGYSTSLGASAQTAADAAALAGEQSVVDQVLASTTVAVDANTLQPAACLRAADYASHNKARVTKCLVSAAPDSAIGFDTLVWAQTDDSLPSGSPDPGGAATAKARASTNPFSQSSPAIKTSISTSCDASVVPGPVFTGASSGDVGFFPDSSANYSFGCEPKLAGALDKLAQGQKLKLQGTAGYVAESQTDASDPAAVAHGCGDASTTPGLESVSDSVLRQYGLIRPFHGRRDVIELAGVSCDQHAKSVDASASGAVGLGNMNVHLVPFDTGGPAGGALSIFGGGGISIGEGPLQVGCQIYQVWQSVDQNHSLPDALLLVSLMVAQAESAMGQNVGYNRTDPNQSVGVFQQISADGWGTIPEELNVLTSAEMFFLGAHDGTGSSTQGLISVYEANPSESTWELAQDTQHSGAGENSHGLANYGAPSNIQAAQEMLGQVTTGACKTA